MNTTLNASKLTKLATDEEATAELLRKGERAAELLRKKITRDLEWVARSPEEWEKWVARQEAAAE